MSIRVRIAPSPTGFLHIGNARAGLFNYLLAKKAGGTFILRLEDTNQELYKTEFEQEIYESFKWLGLEADESPERGGEYGPYRQSECGDLYKKYLLELLEQGNAYYCFHSQDELLQEREEHLGAKRTPLHVCEFRELGLSEAEELKKNKETYIIRFKTPHGEKLVFTDLVRGEVAFDSHLIGDFSIARNLDSALYHFAVVIDDERMKISHVIRGEDHIANTPKQMLLIKALGFTLPQYAHLPLLLGPDRSKLSKRHGDTSVKDYREQGYLPEALLNFIALLGWNPGDDNEILSKEELIEKFDIEQVQKSGAIVDVQKLDWMNGEYIRKKSSVELVSLCEPYLSDFLQFPISNSQFSKEYIEKVIALEQPRLKKLSEIGEKTEFLFRQPEYDKELLKWKSMTDDELVESLNKSKEVLEKVKPEANQEELQKIFFEAIGTGDKGSILWPLRAALSGRKASPGPFEILEVLGTKESIKRIENAIAKLIP